MHSLVNALRKHVLIPNLFQMSVVYRCMWRNLYNITEANRENEDKLKD